MKKADFDWGRLSLQDRTLAGDILGYYREPDLVIAPDGNPYLYRWHVIPHSLKDHAGVFFHIQVSDDPERPLHDHPWDNTSTILSGGYNEIWNPWPDHYPSEAIEDAATIRHLRTHDMIFRKAKEAHRLLLPKKFSYTMTLFSTGPTLRQWGFWTKDGWVPADTLVETLPDGRSIFKTEEVKHG